MKSYGISNFSSISNKTDFHIENIRRKGFSIEVSYLEPEVCNNYINLINAERQLQEKEFGIENLKKISELNMVRMPFLRQRALTKLFLDPFILELTKRILGNAFQLHLQNAIINKAKEEHHQSSWHRDLPYQEWVISKPLAFNAFYCLTDFTIENGATQALPYSHLFDKFPSIEYAEENKISVVAPKGSILFFDSMVYHKAGFNSSDFDRVGVNNLFVVPIIKPQIDVFREERGFSKDELNVLGNSFQTPHSPLDYRNKKLRKNE